MQNQIILIIK